jgi:hypothetical protein
MPDKSASQVCTEISLEEELRAEAGAGHHPYTEDLMRRAADELEARKLQLEQARVTHNA